MMLGLHLDNNLNFDVHISKLCKKAGNQIGVLARLCNALDEPSKMLLYNSFIECYLNYWLSYKIDNLQKKGITIYQNELQLFL